MKKAAGGARKYGRNRESCEKYRREHRREKHIGEFYLLVNSFKEYLLESTNNFIEEENIKLKFTPINSELITLWRIFQLN